MKLTFQKGKQDKIHMMIDGEYRLTVDAAFFAGLSLVQGQELSEEELAELTAVIEERRAYNCAIALLSRRDHSRGELLTKLRQKGHAAGAEAAADKLERDGYLDDRRFAELYTGEVLRLKNYGKKRIEQELLRKGVDREIIRETLENAEFPEDRLTDIIKRKYLRYLSDEKGVRKTINALLRLGYSFGEIKEALTAVSEENESELES